MIKIIEKEIEKKKKLKTTKKEKKGNKEKVDGQTSNQMNMQ